MYETEEHKKRVAEATERFTTYAKEVREEGLQPVAANFIGAWEVSKLTGLSRKVVRKLTLQGIIPHAFKSAGGRFSYNEDAVKAWIESTNVARPGKVGGRATSPIMG